MTVGRDSSEPPLPLRALAPAKVNLCLFLGETREDGRHELVTLFESISLADELVASAAEGPQDEVVCPGVAGPNLVFDALRGLRELGWRGPRLRIEIHKQIPVAAGLGGGSADAAAALRLAAEIAPVGDDERAAVGRALGADVPSQLEPGVAIGTGAGEVVERRSALPPHAFLIVPAHFGLSTADVYREADGLGLARPRHELEAKLGELRAALGEASGAVLPPSLLVNELQPAALSLRSDIAKALNAAHAGGAVHAFVCGSGPTVAGLFSGEDAEARARSAAARLAGEFPGTVAAVPVDRAFGEPRPIPAFGHNSA